MPLSFTAQPAEKLTVSLGWSQRIPSGVTLVSAVVYMSDKVTPLPTTALAADALSLATTISLNDHPGIGALLTINETGINAQIVKVSNVSGGGPYIATVVPRLHFGHTSGEPVKYEPGVSTLVLVSTTAVIAGPTTVFRIQYPVANHTYRISLIAILSSGDEEEGECDMQCLEV